MGKKPLINDLNNGRIFLQPDSSEMLTVYQHNYCMSNKYTKLSIWLRMQIAPFKPSSGTFSRNKTMFSALSVWQKM